MLNPYIFLRKMIYLYNVTRGINDVTYREKA